MTSTRDKNSSGNYCLEQRALENIRNNLAYINAPNGHAANTALPESYLGGRMPPDNLSYNPTDIENVLFGIGSTNLVTPKADVLPLLKTLPEVSFFEREKVIMPEKVYPDNNQRPQI
jgi:hypothetical protein